MADVDLKLTGFKKLQDLLYPGKFPRRLQKAVAVGTKKNALIAEGAIKKSIVGGSDYAANSPVTAAMKGSDRPLVDRGELVKSITGRPYTWNEVIVGVLKSKMVKDSSGRSEDLLSIAKVLHFGATIPVTDKMRYYFFRMSKKFPGRWFPISPKTKVIIIPPRPFLHAAVKKGMVAEYKKNWESAIHQALAGKT